MNIRQMCTLIGTLGSLIAYAFGGWDTALITLLTFMAIDYVTGLIVAGVFKRSNKTKNGALESKAGWKGLCRKGMTLILVLIATRLDAVLGSDYLRDVVCIAFITNEAVSIVENAGLMGVPVPKKLTEAIEVLKSKEE